MACVCIRNHQRQIQLRAPISGQRQANESAAISGHEVYVISADFLSGHHHVAFILTILIVDHDDHFSGSKVGNNIFYCRVVRLCGAIGKLISHG